MDELIIKIPDNSPNANVTIIKNNISKQKSISIEDLVSNLMSNYKLATGLMPPGTRYYKGSANDYTVCIETANKVRDFSVERWNASGTKKIKEKIQIAYPLCLFVFRVVSNKLHVTKLFSLKYPLQTEQDALYMFPFSNVYCNDGRICWGHIVPPKVNKVMQLCDVINLFFSGEYNGDLAGNNFMPPKNESFYDFWSLLKFLEGKKEYSTEWLKANGSQLRSILSE
jgi:hypothetical protein